MALEDLYANAPLLGIAVKFNDGPAAGNHCLIQRGVSDEFLVEMRVSLAVPSLYGQVRSREDMAKLVGTRKPFCSPVSEEIANTYWADSRRRLSRLYGELGQVDFSQLPRTASGLIVGYSRSGAYRGRLVAIRDIGESPSTRGTHEILTGYDYANNRPGGGTWSSDNEDMCRYLATLDPVWLQGDDAERVSQEF